MNSAVLLNHLWQSTACALAAAALAWTLQRHQAKVRFWVWLAASLKFLVPFGALVALGGLLPRTAPAAPPPAALAAMSQPFATVSTTAALAAAAPRSGISWLAILGTAWLLGSIVLAARWFCAWLRLWRLARTVNGERVNASFEPGVFGIFRPVLLLPAALEQRLSAEQLEAVLAHERCHIRRRDNLWSALHQLVEVVFWFHPLVWWIGARMVAERERACDEAVLAEGRNPAAYAGAVIEVCRHFVAVPAACAAGISGGGLTGRVRAVLDGRLGARLSRARWLVLAVCGVAAVAAPVAVGMAWGRPAVQGLPTTFEAFTIKPASPAVPGKPMFHPLRYDPTRFSANGFALDALLRLVYGLKPYALQALLVQQFAIQSHREQRPEQVYVLDLMEASKLHEAAAGEDITSLANGSQEATAAKKMFADLSTQRGPGIAAIGQTISINDSEVTTMLADETMAGLAANLSRRLGRPVINQTNLAARYLSRLPSASASDAQTDGAASLPAPPLANALRDQLGLQLEPRPLPVDMLVIDSAVRAPIGPR